MDQIIQVAGALLILTAFAAVQFNRMHPDSRIYLGLNLAGSAVLAVLAFLSSQWGFVLLEVVWALVSAWGLVSSLRAGGSTHPPAAANSSVPGRDGD